MKIDFENEELNRPVEKVDTKRKAKVISEIKPPAIHKPGLDIDGLEAEVTSDVLDYPNPNWDEVLIKWGYDPVVHEIVEPIKISHWQAVNDGQVIDLYSLKAGVRTKASSVKSFEYKDLVQEVKKHRKMTPKPTGDSAFVINIADTQFGKPDGEGTRAIVRNFLRDIDEVEQRISDLRKIGVGIGHIVIAGVGDIVEGCDQSYGTQTYGVELNRREQVRIGRRLIRDAICRWSKMANEVTVLAVPGNHGENRSNGKIFTTPGDNDDVAIFEQISDILSINEAAYGHVKFVLPEDDIWVALNICGKNIGWAHGHITGRSGTPQQKIQNWWKDQAFGGSDIGNCDILVTGHYHSLSVIEYSENKTHIQCPSRDDGSEWWHDLRGQHSTPGLLTFVLNENGISNLQIV